MGASVLRFIGRARVRRALAPRLLVLGLFPAWRLEAGAAQRTICNNAPVPAGYVIIRFTTSASCGSTAGGTANAMAVSTPYNGISVCQGSPIPDGYVFTRYHVSSVCGSPFTTGTNAIVLTRPYSGISVCQGSPIPDGDVFTRYHVSNLCGSPFTPGTNAIVLSKPYNGIIVCEGSPIPPGYTVTRPALHNQLRQRLLLIEQCHAAQSDRSHHGHWAPEHDPARRRFRPASSCRPPAGHPARRRGSPAPASGTTR